MKHSINRHGWRAAWRPFALSAAVALLFWLAVAPNELARLAGTLLAQKANAADDGNLVPQVAPNLAGATEVPPESGPDSGPEPGPEPGPDSGTAPDADATTSTVRTAPRENIFEDDPLESLAVSLKRRQREMDEREARLKEESQRLDALRKEVESSLARSQQVLKQMEQLAGNAAAQRDKELVRWIKIYEGMTPAQAGQMLGQLNLDFARELLAKMDPKKASKILSAFPPAKAVELGKLLQEKTNS